MVDPCTYSAATYCLGLHLFQDEFIVWILGAIAVIIFIRIVFAILRSSPL